MGNKRTLLALAFGMGVTFMTTGCSNKPVAPAETTPAFDCVELSYPRLQPQIPPQIMTRYRGNTDWRAQVF